MVCSGMSADIKVSIYLCDTRDGTRPIHLTIGPLIQECKRGEVIAQIAVVDICMQVYITAMACIASQVMVIVQQLVQGGDKSGDAEQQEQTQPGKGPRCTMIVHAAKLQESE